MFAPRATLMSSFFERVRAALAPRGYEVLGELATGGMGTVFLARQVVLERLVAIKVIRPEYHTALAAERFLHEAKILASLSHPNIVPVYEADEADGLPYYVMQYLEGETLADRLRKGPLRPEHALKVGRDLLDALEEAHSHGVVHRDVKPSNVFLVNKRAVLVDFGIAKRRPPHDPAWTADGYPRTEPGATPGTRLYMAPEQLAGAEATPLSDLYSAGLVIYEGYTGRHWHDAEHGGTGGAWAGVPRRVKRVLQRALALGPEQRWPDAATFRHELWHTRIPGYQWRTFWLTVGGVGAGIFIAILAPRQPLPALLVRVEPFALHSGEGVSWLGDSLALAVASSLNRYPDVSARGPGEGGWRWPGRPVIVAGDIGVVGESARVAVRSGGGRSFRVDRRSPLSGWRSLADSIADDVFLELLGPTPLDSTLLAGVRPSTRAGTAAFLRAERLFAQARWGDAYAAYAEATAVDTACWLCYWRHVEVGRWLGVPHERSDIEPYLRHLGAFPRPYQSLIRADTLPLAARLDTLESLAKRAPDFLFGQFRFADELMHRGPLIGRSRREAVRAFQQVLRLRSDFGPAWEHLAWIHIADGDSAPATVALAHYEAMGASHDLYTVQVRALLRLAFAWRFLPEPRARALTPAVAGETEAAGVANLDAGARFLPYFGDPHGAIELGRLLEAAPSLERSARIAQALGQLGLGRMDTARAALRRLGDRSGDASLGLLSAELEAALLFLDEDSASAAARWPSVRGTLDEYAAPRAAPPELRRRAAWMERVVASRFESASLSRLRAAPAEERASESLSTFLSALELAAAGHRGRALEVSEPLTLLEPGRGQVADPLLLALVHVMRARWYGGGPGGDGRTQNSRRELLWHEHSDLFRYPTGDPQAAEVDWALGPLAEWTAARLLDANGGVEAACRAYADVKRLWAEGDPRYRARADTAARRFAELHCKAGA